MHPRSRSSDEGKAGCALHYADSIRCADIIVFSSCNLNAKKMLKQVFSSVAVMNPLVFAGFGWHLRVAVRVLHEAGDRSCLCRHD